MKLKRIILELGAGTALHGGDHAKAARRAVDDALHHSSLSFLKSLGLNPADMQVEVTIGVQKPEAVDPGTIAKLLPHGQVTVKVVKGGLDVADPASGDVTSIASAAIAVRMALP